MWKVAAPRARARIRYFLIRVPRSDTLIPRGPKMGIPRGPRMETHHMGWHERREMRGIEIDRRG